MINAWSAERKFYHLSMANFPNNYDQVLSKHNRNRPGVLKLLTKFRQIVTAFGTAKSKDKLIKESTHSHTSNPSLNKLSF